MTIIGYVGSSHPVEIVLKYSLYNLEINVLNKAQIDSSRSRSSKSRGAMRKE
jgi:hypothetical protein